MNKTLIKKDFDNQRYLKVEDATLYFQMGRGLLCKTAKEASAYRKVGRRVLIDKTLLDAFLETQNSEAE